MELWKDIDGYTGRYMISDEGRVKSLSRKGASERILKAATTKCGYKQVSLGDSEGKYKSYLVHRLVALAFIPNPDNLPEVDHHDENKSNNDSLNLTWTDSFDNVHRSQSKEFLFVNPDGEKVKVYNLSKFCRDMDLNQGCMSMIHSGKTKSHRGWRKG